MSDSERKIVLLHEVIEQKIRKEKELEYYQEQLAELQRKMSYVQREIDLTNIIISVIETEKNRDIETKLLEAKQ
jgi:hypothetical protein